MTTILIKKKDTAGVPAPGDLTNAAGGTEIAVNTATKRIYTKDSGGNVVELGTNPSAITGNLLFNPDNSLDIGASGTSRPRSLFLGTNITVGSLTSTRVPYASTGGLLVDSANMTFNGTRLTVADLADSGLTAGRVTYASSGGALVDSANLTFDGTTLTANALTTTSTVTINGGTANGVAYLNGSKVLTTGSALTFDGTTITNTASASSALAVTGKSLVFYNASTSDALLRAADDSSTVTAIGFNKTDVKFYSSGSEQMRLTSTGLGIGTSSPAYKLDMTVTAANNAGMRIYNSTAGTGNGCGISFSVANGFSSTNQHAAIQAISESSGNTTTALGFYTSGGSNTGNATERMRLDSSGNLGLGVTPSAWSGVSNVFQLKGNAYVASTTHVLNHTANAFFNGSNWIYTSTNFAGQAEQVNGEHHWYTAPSGTAGNAVTFTRRMTLDASGNLLLGTTSSSYVSSNRASFVVNGTNQSILGLATGGTNKGYLYSDGTNILLYSESASGFMGFGTNNTERARIDSSGNLLVGTTSNPTANRTLGFSANSGGNGIDILQVANTTDWAINSTSGNVINFYSDNGSALVYAGSINVNGALTAYTSVSDYRLKTVIGPVANAGQRIDALQPVDYTWNADGSRTRGFLAHQFQEVYAASVTGTKDAVDAEGKPVYQQMQASTSEVIADLVAEIQSLRARVLALESN